MQRPPYNRMAFEIAREEASRMERREGRLLAAVAVGLGIVQIVVIWWGDRHGLRQRWLTMEGIGFLVYLALVAGLIYRMVRRVAQLRPTCPQCGTVLKDMSERVAAATGRCDRCGGQVIS